MTSTAVTSRRRSDTAWLAGSRAALPFVVAYAPFGLSIGALAHQSQVSDLLGWSTSWLTYAGTSQLIVIQMIDAGAAPVAIVALVALINVRLVGYSTAISPDWRTAPRWWKALASYVLIDPAYVVAMTHKSRSGPASSDKQVRWQRAFYMGAAVTLWIAWLIECGVGVVVGGRFAEVIPAGALADLMLVAMVVVLSRELGTRTAATAGFALGLPAAALPGGVGATVAAAGSVAIGAIVIRRTS